MDTIIDFLNTSYRIGDSLNFTPGSILLGLFLITILAFVASFVRRLLRSRVLPRAGMAEGVAAAVSSLLYYFLLTVGILMVMPLMLPGFNVQTLSVILGAISFGIGFGLRNIADNFVSGLILLVERPIKVGDRIEVGGVFGDVMEIRARATIVRTNDNVDIIVPNSEFVSGRVTNLSFGGPSVRFKIPVGVHYKSHVHVVTRALIEAAQEVEAVLKYPEPQVRFMEFGDSSLNFELRVWSDKLSNRPGALQSQVNYKIWEKLQKYSIEIPYPQRDIYIKEVPAGLSVP